MTKQIEINSETIGWKMLSLLDDSTIEKELGESARLAGFKNAQDAIEQLGLWVASLDSATCLLQRRASQITETKPT